MSTTDSTDSADSTPSDGSCGVDSTFAVRVPSTVPSPVAYRSVNVPPMSTPTRNI